MAKEKGTATASSSLVFDNTTAKETIAEKEARINAAIKEENKAFAQQAKAFSKRTRCNNTIIAAVVEEAVVEEAVVEEETTIATTIAKQRWNSLKISTANIAEIHNTTVEVVNNVVASKTYLEIISSMFNTRKGWQTWASKTNSTKIAERFWITEKQATAIVESINK